MSYLPVCSKAKYYTQYSQGKTRGQGTWPKQRRKPSSTQKGYTKVRNQQ